MAALVNTLRRAMGAADKTEPPYMFEDPDEERKNVIEFPENLDGLLQKERDLSNLLVEISCEHERLVRDYNAAADHRNAVLSRISEKMKNHGIRCQPVLTKKMGDELPPALPSEGESE